LRQWPGRLVSLPVLFFFAGAGVAVGAGLFSLSKQAADYGEAIYKASQKTGLSAEFLSVAKVRIEETGGSFERFTTGLARFEVALSKSVSNPSSEAARAVGVLHLSLDQLKPRRRTSACFSSAKHFRMSPM
jgi:hypothetical protein